MCGICDMGTHVMTPTHYRDKKGGCKECGSTAVNWLAFLGLFAAVVILFLILKAVSTMDLDHPIAQPPPNACAARSACATAAVSGSLVSHCASPIGSQCMPPMHGRHRVLLAQLPHP